MHISRVPLGLHYIHPTESPTPNSLPLGLAPVPKSCRRKRLAPLTLLPHQYQSQQKIASICDKINDKIKQTIRNISTSSATGAAFHWHPTHPLTANTQIKMSSVSKSPQNWCPWRRWYGTWFCIALNILYKYHCGSPMGYSLHFLHWRRFHKRFLSS